MHPSAGDGGAGAVEGDTGGEQKGAGAVVAEGEEGEEQVIGVALAVAAALVFLHGDLEGAGA